MNRRLACAAATGVLLAVTSAHGHAQQGLVMGKVTDEWGNDLEGTLVTAESVTDGATREETTDDDGDFLFLGLSGGGYQPVRTNRLVQQLSPTRPIELELSVLPTGGRFRSDTEFEAEGGTPTIKFAADGKFEFEDVNGDGEGTYGIVEVSAVMVVRDYDGPDDTYSVSESIVVTFADDQFTSLTWHDTTLMKK